MIIWISGPYGVGKSTLAETLEKEIENEFKGICEYNP